MPVFDFLCYGCGNQFTDLVTSADQQPVCPVCKKCQAQKIVGKFLMGRSENARVTCAAEKLLATDPSNGAKIGESIANLGAALDQDLSTTMSEMYNQDREGCE